MRAKRARVDVLRNRALRAIARVTAASICVVLLSSCRPDESKLLRDVSAYCSDLASDLSWAVDFASEGQFHRQHVGNEINWIEGYGHGIQNAHNIRRTMDFCLDVRALPGSSYERAQLRYEIREQTHRLEPYRTGYISQEDLLNVLVELDALIRVITVHPVEARAASLQSEVWRFCDALRSRLNQAADLVEEDVTDLDQRLYEIGAEGALSLHQEIYLCARAGWSLDENDASRDWPKYGELRVQLADIYVRRRQMSSHNHAEILRSLADFVAESNRIRFEQLRRRRQLSQ